jgi:broad specificity phosphatase PhoE
VVYARLPGFPLAPRGREEAEGVARALAAVRLSAVYASPLERAVETAEIVAGPHGLAVRTDERLLEWSFWSHWEGMPWASIRDRDPEVLDQYGADPEQAWPQDPLSAAGRRVLDWTADVEPGEGGDGIVLGVTHEAPLIAALMVGRGRDLSAYRGTNIPHLGAVRLRPGPPERVDLQAWALTC